MKASGLVLWGSLSALALTLSADGCGGRVGIGRPGAGGDDGGSSGSSSGFSGSSSGMDGSSSGSSGGISGSSSGTSGSSSGVSGSSSGTSGSSSGISGSSSGTSGSSSGISGSSSGSGSGGSPNNGSIYIEECPTPFCESQPFYVFASFFPDARNDPSGNGLVGCTVTASGACAYYSCPTSMQQNGVSAGTIEVSGPWTTPVTVTPGSGTNFYVYSSSSPSFTAGQTLTVTASGATVPAFGPESVVAPQLALLTSPAISPDSGTTIIPTSADLHITWSGGQAGATMQLNVRNNSNVNSYSEMYCTWNASEGQGTIPAAMLKPFSGTNQVLVYGQYNATSFFAGLYAISLVALPYSGGVVSFE